MTSLKQLSEQATNFSELTAIRQYILGIKDTWIQSKNLPNDDFIVDITLEELIPHFLRVAKMAQQYTSLLPKGTQIAK